MGKLFYILTTLVAAGGALRWVSHGAVDRASWVEVLPYSVTYPHTNLYRAALCLALAVYLKALGKIPRTDPALTPLLMTVRAANARRGLAVVGLSFLALLAGWWVSANSRLPDFYEFVPFRFVPEPLRLEFVQIASVTVVLGTLFLVLFICGRHAKAKQDLSLRYAENFLLQRRRVGPSPPPPSGAGNHGPTP